MSSRLQHRITLCLGMALLLFSRVSYSQDIGVSPNFSRIDSKEKKAVGTTLAIEQDHLGVMWFGGTGGLARFDGYRFHYFEGRGQGRPSPTEKVIRDIHSDSQNRLWVATEGSGLLRLNRAQASFASYSVSNDPSSSLGSRFVHFIFEDKQGQLWVGGDRGGLSRYVEEQDRFQRELIDSPLAATELLSMEQVDEHRYMFGSASGVFLWNRQTAELNHFVADSTEGLRHNIVRTLARDSLGRIWVGTDNGATLFYPDEKRFSATDVPDLIRQDISVWELHQDDKDGIWATTDGLGMLYYSADGQEFQYRSDARNPNSLSSNVVRTLYFDREDDIWVGVYPSGINHYDRTNAFFKSHTDFISDSSNKSATWSFSETANGDLWVGTDSGGLVYLDRKQARILHEYQERALSDLNLPIAILELFEDSRQFLWLGSWLNGLYRINLEDFTVRRYLNNLPDNGGFDAESVWRIVEDKTGNLWIATMHNGLFRYDLKTDQFFRYQHDPKDASSLNHNTVWTLFIDSRDRLWIGSRKGAARYNPVDDNFIRYESRIDDADSLSHHWVQEFAEDHNGDLWIATQGGGLNRFLEEEGRFERIGLSEGLNSLFIAGLIAQNDYLWVSSDNGVSRYHIDSGKVTHFNERNWTQGKLFNRGAFLSLTSGEMVFGGENGFSILDPSKVVDHGHLPDVYFTELKVFGETIEAGDATHALEQDITAAESITLRHDQSVFELSFTLPSYRGLDNHRYMFYLNGFEHQWREPTLENTAYYTNLDPGKYEFRVKAMSSSGDKSDSFAAIAIHVLPSPWKTWWAYTAYSLLVLSIFVWYIRLQRAKIRDHQRVNSRLQELDYLKDEILANTSHELRTPLNGIIGLAEIMRSGNCGRQTPKGMETLSMIISSGQRLSALVNDILDYSKINNAELIVNFDYIDVPTVVRFVYEQILPIVNKDFVTLENHVTDNMGSVYADENRLVQVLMNLMGNAVKYTREGSINIRAESEGDYIAIYVQDTGIGIAKENLKRIFGSFEQAANSGVHTKSGTGLGLAITEKLVSLQNGSISVESELDVGSVFCVRFPRNPIDESPDSHVTKDLVSQSEDVQVVEYAPTERRQGISILIFLQPGFSELELVTPLLKNGYRVCLVTYHEKFISTLLEGQKPDLIVLTVPKQCSLTISLCHSIRRHFPMSKTPIMLLHMQPDSKDACTYFTQEVNDVLAYPLCTEEFLLRVNKQSEIQKLVHQTLKNGDTYLSSRLALSNQNNPLPFFADRRQRGEGETASNEERVALIVDDEEVNRMVLRHQLFNHGFNVYEACNGQAALDSIRDGAHYDVIYLDLMMPGISGLEVCQEIRKTISMLALPIIFVTAKSQIGDLTELMAAGANDVLNKPVNVQELFSRTDSAIKLCEEIRIQLGINSELR